MNFVINNKTKNTIATLFSLVALSTSFIATAQANEGKAHGKNKVEVCHIKNDGEYKLLTIPLNAALTHMEKHDDDFFSAVDGECVLTGDICPLDNEEVDTILATFESTTPSGLANSITDDTGAYCRFDATSNTGNLSTMYIGARSNPLDAVILLQVNSGAGSVEYPLTKYGTDMTNEEARACGLKFACEIFPSSTDTI